MPRSTHGEKWKADLDQVGPTLRSSVCYDDGKSAVVGIERDGRNLPEILLGRVKLVSAGEMYGGVEDMLQTN
jgi:hypothetical protein